MTDQKLTYPEYKPRLWALAMPWKLHQIEAELRKGLTGSEDTPRYRAFADTLSAIHHLAHERDVHEFRGDKVHRLLVKAARVHGWYAPEGKKRPLPKAHDPENNKVCKGCYEEKPRDVFRTVATVAQKKRMGRNPDAQHYIMGNLCDACRLSLARRTKRKAGKKEALTLVTALQASITTAMEAANKVIKKNVAFTTPDGFEVSKLDDESLDYYTERRVLIRRARQRFDAYIEDGTLAQRIKIPPEEVMWHALLTDEERADLKARHARGKWMQSGYRSRIPTLWEKSGAKGRAGFKQMVDDSPTPTPAPLPAQATVITSPEAPNNADDGHNPFADLM